eukprot:6196541-Pleurochrysis_carterae.AAC.7
MVHSPWALNVHAVSGRHHPDRNPDNREAAQEKFRQVSDAYATLSGKGGSSGGGPFGQQQGGFGGGGFGGGYGGGFGGGNGGGYGGGGDQHEWQRMQNEQAERIFREAFGGLETLLRQAGIELTHACSYAVGLVGVESVRKRASACTSIC